MEYTEYIGIPVNLQGNDGGAMDGNKSSQEEETRRANRFMRRDSLISSHKNAVKIRFHFNSNNGKIKLFAVKY